MVIYVRKGYSGPPLCSGAQIKDEAKGLNDCFNPPGTTPRAQAPSFLFSAANLLTLRAQPLNRGDRGSGHVKHMDCTDRSRRRRSRPSVACPPQTVPTGLAKVSRPTYLNEAALGPFLACCQRGASRPAGQLQLFDKMQFGVALFAVVPSSNSPPFCRTRRCFCSIVRGMS
jgi:hypothetical protein